MYQFPVPRKRKAEQPKPAFTIEDVGEQEALPATIQGIPIGSKEEARVAVALDMLRIGYEYQHSIRGGTSVRGGQIVDFVVYNPMAQPVQAFGEYYHPGEMDPQERFNLAVIQQVFGRPAIVLWASELQTQAAANEAVRFQVG